MDSLNWVHLLLFTFLTFNGFLNLQAQKTCSIQDRAALLSFKSSILKDTTEALSTWVGTDCCQDWEGVTCQATTGRVSSLILQGKAEDSSSYMKGNLTPALGNLQLLQVLVVSGMKHINGAIPETLSKLTFLTQLVLEDNSLEGTIPSSLGQLTSLSTLSLTANRLVGKIPVSLRNLRNVVQLNLGKNSFSGPIPPIFTTLQKLQFVDFSSNQFSGTFPNFSGEFPNLTTVDFSKNQFSGEIPASVFALPALSSLSLSQNQFAGKIPDQIGESKSLTQLQLSGNRFSGQIPASFAKLTNLWYLNLSRNAISGPLPASLGQGLPSLSTIDLSYNNLGFQTVPEWILNRELYDVRLAGCGLTGTLPIFTKPGSLTAVDLSDNAITDGTSVFFRNLSSLAEAKLGNNKIKLDISNLQLPNGLRSLDLHSNQLFGSLSGIINNGTGTSSLETLDLSRNQLSGKIPEFVEGSSLKIINVGSNRIAGAIPNSISNLVYLEKLDFSRNVISGTVPTSFGELGNLQWLDLSVNQISGKIPSSFLGLGGLRHANFRANRLCGEIPQGRPFNVFKAVAYAHNLCLCGKPLPACRRKSQ